MARKLTEEEHAVMELVRDGLMPIMPSAKKNAASGIASALVRTKNQTIDQKGLDRLFAKYEIEGGELKEQIQKAVLEWDGASRTYTINSWIKEYAAGQVGQAAEPADEAEAADISAEEEQPAAETPSEASEEEQATEEAKPRRRRRRTRKPKEAGEASAEAAAEDLSGETEAAEGQPVEEVPAAPEEASEEEAPKEEKPRRRRSRRTRKAQPAEPEPESISGETAEAAPAGEEEHEAEADAEDAQAEEAEEDQALGIDADAAETDRVQEPAPAPVSRILPPKPSHSRDLRKIPYVRRGGETDAEIRQKIVQLDERFWMNGWLLSHPKAYTLFEHEIVTMNDILQDGMLPGDITRRQLAYQMGGDEKFFEYGSDGFRLLRALGMEDIIRHRPLPKSDLVYHAPRRRKHMRVLVTENLDPYLDVHDLMYEEGRSTILGERIHAVVLGGGTPIVEHNRLALLLDTLGADTIEVLYWGDIDRAGLSIMNRLADELGGKYGFKPFAPAYQLMVDKAQERFPDPADNENTKQINIEDYDVEPICSVLTDEAAAYAKAVVDSCELIPQEILTKQDL